MKNLFEQAAAFGYRLHPWGIMGKDGNPEGQMVDNKFTRWGVVRDNDPMNTEFFGSTEELNDWLEEQKHLHHYHYLLKEDHDL